MARRGELILRKNNNKTYLLSYKNTPIHTG